MYKVINGKRYNTETAKEVAQWWNGISVRDFSHCYETLYRKSTGEFFLHGEGGPMSPYAESCGMNETSGGERIIPLSYKEAQKWAEDHLDGDEYEKIFGIPDSDEKQTVAIRLSSSAIAKLKNLAAEEQISMSEVIEELIMK